MSEDHTTHAPTLFGERKYHTSADAIASGDWIAVQKKTFTKWVNFYLKTRKESIADLYSDLRTGVKLIHLLEIIGKDPMPRRYKEDPKMEIHCKENLKTAFDWLRGKGMDLSIISGDDIASGNEKLTLGLIWTLIATFNVDDIVLDGVSGKEGLKLWCVRQVADYDNVEIADFSRSWKNGLAFCALMHRYRPDAFDYASLSPANARENIELALSTAEKYFDVDRLFDPEDVCDMEKPDEKVVITYVSIVFRALAKYIKAEGLVKSVKRALDITRRHDQWISQYLAQAQEFQSLITQTSEAYSTTEYGNSTANIKAALDAFYEYKRDTKPQYQAIQASLQGLYATLTSSAKNNNRPLFQPEEALTLAGLSALWDTLEATEDTYELGVRREHMLFSSLDNIIARFNVKAETVTSWMTAAQATFDSGHHGNSRTEVETLLEAHAAFELQLVYNNKGLDALEEWSSAEGMEKHEMQATLVENVESMRGTMAALQESATAYHAALLVSKEKHKNLALLLKVESWIDQQSVVFASGDHGDSVVAAEDLLRVWTDDYTPAVARHRAMIAIETDQEEVTTRIAEVSSKLDDMEAAGQAYKTAVELSIEKHKQLFLVTKVEVWMEKQLETFVSGEYGETWDATRHLLEDFSEQYEVQLAQNKQTLAMDPVAEDVTERLATATARMEQVEETAGQYQAALAQTMENHKDLYDLTKTYNSKATDFMFAATDIEEESQQPMLYQSEAEVQEAQASFESELRTKMVALTESYNEINGYAERLTEAGAEEAFSRYTIVALYERHEEVSGKLDARESALEEHLATEQAKEELRVKFAELATAFKTLCDTNSATVTALEGDLETQISTLQAMRTETSDSVAQLEELQSVSEQLDEMGVVNNPHTSETAMSLRAVWEVLGKTYTRTEEALQGQLLAERSGQITPEQYKEIKDVMVYFDQDLDECLNDTEFRNCLTGLGLVMTEDEINTVMTELDSSGDRKLNFDEFAKFMVKQLSQPGHTQEDVITAFRALAEDDVFIPEEIIVAHFHDEDDRAYLLEHMPVSEEPEKRDYEAFVGDLFSR